MACPQEVTCSSLSCSSTPLSRGFPQRYPVGMAVPGSDSHHSGVSLWGERGVGCREEGAFLPVEEEPGNSMSPGEKGMVVNPTPLPRSLSSSQPGGLALMEKRVSVYS